MEIFQIAFDVKQAKSNNIENILAVIARAMVSMSVESVAES